MAKFEKYFSLWQLPQIKLTDFAPNQVYEL